MVAWGICVVSGWLELCKVEEVTLEVRAIR